MKQRHKFESIVAETLLIPLYYRAKESRRKNPILNDKVAEGLVDSLEYDYSRFDGAKLSEVGCVVRGWFFDRAVRRFIGKHADAVVVNVGCGLDTRFQRIGDGKAVFYDMDLPEVIALRRELIPEQPGNPYIAASLLDAGWLDDLRRRHPDAHFIFVVEGVLMYFYEKQVKTFLHHVAERFGGGELWFDVCGTMMSRHGVKPDSLREPRGANPLRSERRASGRTMGTPPTPFGTGQLHEVFPSALGLLLRANIGTDDAAVLQVQFDVGI